MHNSNESLKHKVVDWLNKGGFPLELRVAQLLRANGWSTASSVHYEDPKHAETFREIDIWASKKTSQGTLPSDSFQGIVNLIIECKNNADRPFVLFGEDIGKVAPGIVAMAQITNRCGKSLLDVLHHRIQKGEFRLFNHPTTVYHSVVTALRSDNPNSSQGKDIAYEAVNQCLAGTYAWRAIQDSPYSLQVGMCSILIPVVVVSGSLFQAVLNETGNIEIEEIEGGVLQQRSKFSDDTIADLVWIFSEKGLERNIPIISIAADHLISQELIPEYQLAVNRAQQLPNQ